MQDILPEEQKYWKHILDVIVKPLVEAYGYQRIDTPILEQTQLFVKGTGKTTDIVEKEMYNLTTKGGDKLSLRPELTPNVVRAYFEHGMGSWPQPVKLYSIGPVFRHDRPQAGRLRQFHQINLEAIGSQDPVLDAQIIQLSSKIAQSLDIKDSRIQINSIGCPNCRPAYINLLQEHYKGKARFMCTSCKARLRRNALRLLDCKEAGCRRLSDEAPQSVDYLCSECHEHFKSVLECLDELDLPYELNYRLVRGLDYYTKTVFEIFPEPNLGGGGRYDGLAKIIGKKDIPGVGAALGIERFILQLQEQKIKIFENKAPQIFLAQLGSLAKKRALKLFSELVEQKIGVIESFSRDSLKAQLRIADKLGVSFSLILGQKEALENSVIIRNMETGVQEVVLIKNIIKELKKKLK